MNYFKDHTYLPATKEEYVIEIDKALKEDNKELRKNEFLTHQVTHGKFVIIYDQIE